ncbi:hypothetical protein PBN151_3605 [Paenibacillus sp. NAIST15-1]|nr:hypothetical protein PBN151_3605 [Paenibacillus sp. NAIST15-1]
MRKAGLSVRCERCKWRDYGVEQHINSEHFARIVPDPLIESVIFSQYNKIDFKILDICERTSKLYVE